VQARLVAAALAASAVAGGCAHSYTAVSYDVTRKTTGTMSAMTTNPARKSGAVAFGFGARGAAMEIHVQADDLETAVNPWFAGSVGFELKLTPVRKGPFAAFMHGGPMRSALVDSKSGEITWGAGLGYGLGLMLGTAGVNAFVDVRFEQLFYAGEPMTPTDGSTSQRTVAVGLQFGG